MRAVILLKTSDGGLWSVPFAEGLRDAGHEVVFALPSERGALPDLVRASGMSVMRAEAPVPGASLRAQIPALMRLRRQLTSEGTDVVVSHLHASALAGRMSLAMSDIPHVYMSAGPLYLENPVIRTFERVAQRFDDHIICSSRALYDSYRALGVPTGRLSRIPYVWRHNAPSADATSRAAARAELGLEESSFLYVCVAMFYAPKSLVHRGRGIKGHDVLLRAWNEYCKSGGSGELLLVGGGFGAGGEEYRSGLQTTFQGVPRVRWIPVVDDVRPYYAAADVSVSPSLSENLGAPAEASMMGVPSVASAVGGLPEIVEHAWNGWLVEPASSTDLARALSDARHTPTEILDLFGERARLRASELFDRERNTRAFVHVVEETARRG